MTGRRTAIGLALICAFGFCAFAAPSAMAAKGTTAFTCAPAGAGAKEFQDAHCDTTYSSGTGFKHEAIAAGTETEIHVTNEKTKSSTTEPTSAQVHFGGVTGLAFDVVCKKVGSPSGTAFLKNEVGPPMKASGKATISFTECEVLKPAGNKCAIQEPWNWQVNFQTKVIKESPEEMGMEFTPQGANITELSIIEGPSKNCPGGLAGMTLAVSGSMIGTPGGTANGKGATLAFTKAMTKETLAFGGFPVEVESTVTLAMTNEATAENAIVLTTTAS
jgi:hypothetical protein